MIYFTYKLKWVQNNGYSPKKDCCQEWLSMGHAGKSDGTFLGYSTKASLPETFTSAEISDHQIAEITADQAKARFKECGMNEPILEPGGYIIDNNPPYLEKRGWKYIEKLGGVKP
jgi:hypothetical protein